ncbi:uncharacterized protein LOC117662010 isoform X2 [Pantherophis guttatus]|uniref:Uncharacterized protein LOC117662010 isoform X2 n=1 Tax=Pantherophis guttatus TaxID=94885 RepID=A0A6P9B8F4_PANGU|nr:uncharacterized protein LOC117662010 isoform X2 [Pantherophis guttatus]
MAVRRLFRNIWKRCSHLFCCLKSNIEDLPVPPDSTEEAQEPDDQQGEWETHHVSDGDVSSLPGVVMGGPATARSPRKEDVRPALISRRNERMPKWTPRLTTIWETCTESDPSDVEEGGAGGDSACLSGEERQEHWRPRLSTSLETCTELEPQDQPVQGEISPDLEKTSSEDSLTVLAGSRTSSLWDLDLDSLADLLEEESEDSRDQDAEASSSPWRNDCRSQDSPEEGEDTLEDLSSLEEDILDSLDRLLQ